MRISTYTEASPARLVMHKGRQNRFRACDGNLSGDSAPEGVLLRLRNSFVSSGFAFQSM
jgi:hypothetical protein